MVLRISQLKEFKEECLDWFYQKNSLEEKEKTFFLKLSQGRFLQNDLC